MPPIVTICERDFAEFVQLASEEDLESESQTLEVEINTRYANIRSPLADRMRERLGVLNQALGYCEAW